MFHLVTQAVTQRLSSLQPSAIIEPATMADQFALPPLNCPAIFVAVKTNFPVVLGQGFVHWPISVVIEWVTEPSSIEPDQWLATHIEYGIKIKKQLAFKGFTNADLQLDSPNSPIVSSLVPDDFDFGKIIDGLWRGVQSFKALALITPPEKYIEHHLQNIVLN